MTVAGLDGHCETTEPLMHSSCNEDVYSPMKAAQQEHKHTDRDDGVIQLSPLSSYAVLELVEISHASCVGLHL